MVIVRNIIESNANDDVQRYMNRQAISFVPTFNLGT